ncbi:Cullin-4A [Strongyloides ratti]|uniref:Cullin-4A n=1 Tax=Strongyloides ratti TaxID=34506 RepID=A0A090MYX0_STRRB|nr:Cullin-4A [Strongyloides ratti]CEF67919.1 Cullin-4A [Strongyloides ratti]
MDWSSSYQDSLQQPNSKFLELINEHRSSLCHDATINEKSRYNNFKTLSSRERKMLGKFYSSVTAEIHDEFTFPANIKNELSLDHLLNSMIKIVNTFLDSGNTIFNGFKEVKYVELLTDIKYVALFYSHLEGKFKEYIPRELCKYINIENDFELSDYDFLSKFVDFYNSVNSRIYQLEIYFKKLNQNGLLANSTLLPIRKLANNVICQTFESVEYSSYEDRIGTCFINCLRNIVKDSNFDCKFYKKTWNLMTEIGMDISLRKDIFKKFKKYNVEDAKRLLEYDSIIDWTDYVCDELNKLKKALTLLPLSYSKQSLIKSTDEDFKKTIESPFINILECYPTSDSTSIKFSRQSTNFNDFSLYKKIKLEDDSSPSAYDCIKYTGNVPLNLFVNDNKIDSNFSIDSDKEYTIYLQVEISMLEAARSEYCTATTNLLEKQIERMSVLYEEKNILHLKKLYKLLPTAKENAKVFNQSFLNFILSSITKSIEKEENEEKFINELITLRKFCLDKLLNCYDCDSSYVDCINISFRRALNKGSEKICVGSTIAKYLDKVLKNWHLRKDDTETFEQVVQILRHVDGKGPFENKYHSLLAKRILNDTSYDESAERQMIQLLREQIGDKIISHMESMLLDIDLSRQILQDFRKYLSKTEYHDMYIYNNSDIKILTSIKWPVTLTSSIIYPEEFTQFQELFEKFYNPKHKKKRLHYQPNLTDVVITATFDSCVKELIMTLVQATVLLLFNKHETLTSAEIQKLTGMGKEDTERSIRSLSRENILICSHKQYTVNTKFTHLQQRINVRQLHMKAAPILQELSAADKKEAQKNLLEAASCRILKVNKQETLVNLHQLAMKETKLAVSLTEFKIIIEGLITKGFLERDKTNKETIMYIP